MGMNVIVHTESDPRWIVGRVAVMTVMSAWLLRWARRQGW